MMTPCKLLLAAVLLVSSASAPRSQGGGRRDHASEQTVGQGGRSPRARGAGTAAFGRAEAAYRANNLGVALLEQFKHKEGAEEFRRALDIAPRLALARVNLAIALYNVPEVAAAEEAAREALHVAPSSPQANYVAGLIARQQNRVEEAVAHFKKVLEVDPRDTGANVNLGQLYAQRRDYEGAVARLRAAVEAEPYNGTALYNLGTALLRTGKREEGQRLIQRFQELRQSGAATVVGQNYLEQGRYAEAVTSTGAEAELVSRETPPVRFVDATAQVFAGRAVSRGGRAGAAGARETRRGGVRRGGRASGPEEARRGAAVETEAWEFAASLGGGVTLFDMDGDGDLDLLDLAPRATRLYRNDRGRFTDVSARAGDLARGFDGVNVGAVAGDYDNDGREDLFVLRYGGPALYRNEGGGRFTDSTASARVPAYGDLALSAAFVDADHDGDLDIFVAGFAEAGKFRLGERGEVGPTGGASNLLLRNNGDGTFVDVTREARVAGEGRMAVAVVPTDYDNRRDVDLLVVNYGAAPTLYRNLRDATFRDVAGEVGLAAPRDFTAAAAGDVNKDEFTDFYFAARSAPGASALSDGRRGFKLDPQAAGGADARGVARPFAREAAQFFDYDNDGLLDLLKLGAGGGTGEAAGLRVWRNVGGGEWRDVSRRALHGPPRRNRERAGDALTGFTPGVLASGDADGDGDTDLFLRSSETGALVFLRNDGGERNKSVRVRLAGKVSNRSGVGSKIEARAGSLQQKLEVYSATPAPAPADVTFGLGPRAAADAVRVIWPSGVVQAETESVSKEGAQTVARVEPGALRVTELDRKPSSCPYLYAWNGERFEFVTDFMGGGELGYYVAPGVRAAPDPDEYVRIPPGVLKERDGRFELRVTNELEEALFIDRLQLAAVAHPEGVEVHPNEGLGNPTSSEFKLYAVRGARPPRAARDERGRDLLAKISRLDRQFADGFTLLPLRGYAAEHSLVLDLGGDESAARHKEGAVSEARTSSPANSSLITHHSSLLLLTGWTDYAFSSDNVAAAQRGLRLSPPKLQVRDEEGNWRTVIENIGIPVGRPQTVAVNLAGKFLSSSREVRIVTNMRIYWDQVLVGATADNPAARVERLEAAEANLGWRGFSAVQTPDGREPYLYDYARGSSESPWKALPGRYTRLGDVRELLAAVDDIFVVSRPGDEIRLSFDARALQPLPAGWTRTFMLYADGFSKEMDINSSSPHELAPLPFHGMKSYPYEPPDAYPSTPAHQSYVERYNTRVVAAPLPSVITGDT
jgi:tetratricopeptide (TPR) repeat protein